MKKPKPDKRFKAMGMLTREQILDFLKRKCDITRLRGKKWKGLIPSRKYKTKQID